MISIWAKLLQSHKKTTFSILLIISTLSFFLVSKGNFSSNILDMLPVEDRIISKHLDFLTLFESMNQVIFEVSLNDSTDNYDHLVSVTKSIIDSIKKSNAFIFEQEMVASDFFSLRNTIITNWPNLFSEKDSLWINSHFNEDSMVCRLDKTISSLFTFSDGAVDPFSLKHDPFSIATYALTKLSAFKPAQDITIDEGFITNNSHTRIMFFAMSKGSAMNETTSAIVKKTMSSIEKVAQDKACTFTWMGAIRASADNSDTIKKDIYLTLPIALFIIFLICFGIYSKFYFGFLSFLPTALGILITLAFFTSFLNLSIIILGFGAALLGITIDYAIHFLYHIDDMSEDKNPVKTLSGPILSSAFTTAGAFLVLSIAGIPGLAQLGIVTAFGIIIVALLSLLVLPLFSLEKKQTHKQAFVKPAIWFNSFYTKSYDSKLAIPLIIVVITSIFFINKISFDGDPNSMNGMKPETIEAEAMLAKNWPGVQNGTYLVVTDTSFSTLCQKVEQNLQQVVGTLLQEKLINPTALFTLLVPSMETQKRNRQRWRNTMTNSKITLMNQAIKTITKKYVVPAESFLKYTSAILNIDSMPYVSTETYPKSFRTNLLKKYVRHSDSLWYANVPVFPITDTVWIKINSIAKKQGVLAVNDAMLGLRVIDIIKTGFFRCVIFIPIIVTLILIIMLRSAWLSIIAITPPLCATAITLATMVIINLPINIISLMIFAFIFGLGIDYTLLMLYMSRKRGSHNNKFISHGAASITVAACTTIAGLGILAIAKHPVLVTLGVTGLIGIVSSYVCAIVLVPIMVRLEFKLLV